MLIHNSRVKFAGSEHVEKQNEKIRRHQAVHCGLFHNSIVYKKHHVAAYIGPDSHPLEFDIFVYDNISMYYYRKTGCRRPASRVVFSTTGHKKQRTHHGENRLIVLRENNKFHRIKMACARRILQLIHIPIYRVIQQAGSPFFYFLIMLQFKTLRFHTVLGVFCEDTNFYFLNNNLFSVVIY